MKKKIKGRPKPLPLSSNGTEFKGTPKCHEIMVVLIAVSFLIWVGFAIGLEFR